MSDRAELEIAAAKLALGQMDNDTVRALVRAVNHAAERGRTLGSRLIREQVKLPAGYVNSRLHVDRKANPKNITAMITGRGRATQLSRFGARQLTQPAKLPGKRRLAGVRVEVKPGQQKVLPGAWLMSLKRGHYSSGNVGVVTRTGPGPDDYRVHYGPSVDQLWRDVREQVAPEIDDLLLAEFILQLER